MSAIRPKKEPHQSKFWVEFPEFFEQKMLLCWYINKLKIEASGILLFKFKKS